MDTQIAELLLDRQLLIHEGSSDTGAVVYVMSRDQRVNDNYALLIAQSIANQQQAPLYVLFVLKHFSNRSREHYTFMLDGLREVAQDLNARQIPFVIRNGLSENVILQLCIEVGADQIVFDFSPLRGPRLLAKQVAKSFEGTTRVVDTHNIIPLWCASTKQEFAAHTMRSKVHKQLARYLVEPPKLQRQQIAASNVASLNQSEIEDFVRSIPSCGIKVPYTPGEAAALQRLQTFIQTDLESYASTRNDIATDHQSGLSPYLHFGQLSSLRVALEVMATCASEPLLFKEAKLASPSESIDRIDGMNALFDEMIVRKELADNYCFYNHHYTSLEGAPVWATQTLAEHAHDPRTFVYTKDEWERAATHDPIWNAAQTELMTCGKIHGYMRMYWAKKLLEWSASPAEAIETAIWLNDKYSIDGGDPNGYVGILWSIAGLHDRPWFERPVYGKIRYMNDNGIRRKFDVDAYIKRVTN